MTGFRDYDRELEDEFKTNTIDDRAAFYLPSEQSQFRKTREKSLKHALSDAMWANMSNDPVQKVFNQPFTEIEAKDIPLYNKPPRG